MSKQWSESFQGDSWNERTTEINKDIKSDNIREDIKINLTDKEYSNLKLLAYKAGFESAGKFLSSFVGDLTGWHSNGSDERDIADQWYQRAFGMSEYYSNFRYHLFNYDYCLDDIQEMIEDQDFFNQVYDEYLGECYAKENQSKEECLEVLKEIIIKGVEL